MTPDDTALRSLLLSIASAGMLATGCPRALNCADEAVLPVPDDPALRSLPLPTDPAARRPFAR